MAMDDDRAHQNADGNRQPSWLAPRGHTDGLPYYVSVVREHLWMIVVMTVVAVALAAAYVTVAPKKYSAQANIQVTPLPTNDSYLAGFPGVIEQSADPTADITTAALMPTTPQVAAAVVAKLHLNETPQKALSTVTADPEAESDDVAVSATAPTPAGAAALANAFVTETIATTTAALHQQIASELPGLIAKQAALPKSQQNGSGSLAAEISQLEAQESEQNPSLSVASLAQTPTAPSSPKRSLSLIAGLIAGLVLGLIAAFVRHAFDPQLRREEQVRDLFNLPVLARVPRLSPQPRPLTPRDMTPAANEAYRTLRAAFTSREHAGGLAHAVMVTGDARGQGKTTTAINLAASLAAAAHHVILIEADVRKPNVGRALRVRPRYGLASLLAEQISLVDALVWSRNYGPNLELLLVGDAAPQVVDRLTLPSLRRLVREARELADYVIIDAPPLTEVSDGLPLIDEADDVVLVAAIGTSRIGSLTELGDVLARRGVEPFGIVLVGVDEEIDSPYYIPNELPADEAEPASSGRSAMFGLLRRRSTEPSYSSYE
jgi:capsular exopolysaccharide synthesis family protein